MTVRHIKNDTQGDPMFVTCIWFDVYLHIQSHEFDYWCLEEV